MKRIAVLLLVIAACSTPPERDAGSTGLSPKAVDAMNRFRHGDEAMAKDIDAAAGFAIFPRIIKGGLVIGGGRGAGEVYEKGTFLGSTKVTMATIGFQIGAQGFAELILFETKAALDRFTAGKFEFSAQVTAVAVNAGVSYVVKYRDGVAVFTIGTEGLMAEAAAGGQKFSFTPK